MENPRHLNKKQMAMVYRKKRSKQYQQEGYKNALFVTNAFLLERIFAFAFDTCMMFLPILLWELCMLLMFVGLFPIALLETIQMVTFVLMVISMFTFNALLSVKSGGQTLGKYFYDLKVVNKRRKETAPIKLIAREIVGFSLPTFVLFLLFNIIGVLAYWGIDFIFALLHPYHISIIDLFLGTRIVVLRERKAEVIREEQTAPVSSAHTTIDLHLHSNFSDEGQYNVEELFQVASQRGLRMISICDHNSVKANLSAMRMAGLYHVSYIPGGEFDCRYHDTHLRILGYFIDSTNDIFIHLENESLKRERKASLSRVEMFTQLTGIDVDVNELLAKSRYQKISGEMIAAYVLEQPSSHEHPLLVPYLYGAKREDPIRSLDRDYFHEDAPCYVEVRHPKLKDILDIIHLSGGVAVLSGAVDVLAKGEDYFAEIIAQGIEGVEVFTPQYSTSEMALLLKLAKEHQLFVSCGSGFYGSHESDVHIGETGCPLEAEKIIREFFEEYQSVQ